MRYWWVLVRKEWQLELKQKYAVNGILLYLIGSVFICYLSFNLQPNALNPVIWNALLWILLLFTAINALSKSFVQESAYRDFYYYTLVPPQALIMAKMAYNAVLMLGLGVVGFGLYALVLGNPVQDMGLYSLAVIIGCVSFSSALTMLAGIAGKARNNGSLMAIMSFPVVLPILLLVIRIAKNAMDGLDRSESAGYIWVLGAISVILGTLSWILYPYLWRS
ncbi:MAG TPA: ABC transporter permease [Cytophagales bacterium]|nr:ABC transporter permease [Cytophagales bacterium]HAA17443.1 ABC transporter permease [Cytophagales bacterium]HAP62414.1 ABC transporter permease [Cytophagales bacterium]